MPPSCCGTTGLTSLALDRSQIATALNKHEPDIVAAQWRKEYGGLKVDQARRMKDLERENARLKKLVADLALDKAILQEASKLTF